MAILGGNWEPIKLIYIISDGKNLFVIWQNWYSMLPLDPISVEYQGTAVYFLKYKETSRYLLRINEYMNTVAALLVYLSLSQNT